MKRFFGLLVIVTALTAGVSSSHAQSPGKVWRISILSMSWAPWHNQTAGFRDKLKELGYEEGQNLTFEVRLAKGASERLPELAAELVGKKPDLLYCAMGPEAQACHKATQTIPIVFTQASNPVKLGLVQSLARPGGNVTGVGSLRAELAAKRLEIFKEIVPSLRRVLVTYDPREGEEAEAVEFARKAATRLGLTLLERPITDPLEMEPGLEELRGGGQDGILIVQPGPNLNIPGRSLMVATTYKIPTMYPSSMWTKFGALASYGPNQYQQGRLAARLAHKILTGTPPRRIPVELPTDIEFVINIKTAKKIGMEVSAEALFRANQVIR